MPVPRVGRPAVAGSGTRLARTQHSTRSGHAAGQSETTAAITGQVTDQTGAALPGAAVVLTGTDSGIKRTAETNAADRFSFPQFKPSTYDIEVTLAGFESQHKAAITAGLGQVQTLAFVLSVAAAREEVLVAAEAPLLNTDNPNTATTLNARALENLPNPGSDLTYPAQFAPGALMNTHHQHRRSNATRYASAGPNFRTSRSPKVAVSTPCSTRFWRANSLSSQSAQEK